jgi:hypothetical protein
MSYIESTKHSPVERLNVILGASPKPDRVVPFDTLDALYTHIFSSAEDHVLTKQILSFMAIPRAADDGLGDYTTPAMIELLLPVSSGSVSLILEQLRSVIDSAGSDEPIKFWHASISDFLLDDARSKDFFVDIQMAHEALASGYLRLFQSDGPDHFMVSPFFSSFMEHYKKAVLSERLQQELVAYDFFSHYKAAIGCHITFWELKNVWDSDIVARFFSTLVCPQFMTCLCLEIHPKSGQVQHPQGQSIVDVYVNGVYRNYPLEQCVKESLQLFVDSKNSVNFV